MKNNANKHSSPITTSIIFSLSSIPIIVFTIYSTYLRLYGRYFDIIIESSGIEEFEISFLDRLLLFRTDILLTAVALPLILIILRIILNSTTAKIIATSINICLLLFLYGNLQSWGQVGNFLSYSALIDSIVFGFNQPQLIFEYLSWDGILKLLLLATASVAFIFFDKQVSSIVSEKAAILTYAAVATFLITLSLATLSSNIKTSPITDGFFVNAVRTISNSNPQTEILTHSQDELIDAFNKLHRRTDTIFHPLTSSKNNVIIFVMETGAFEFFNTSSGLDQFPELKKLKNNVAIYQNHLTTFPASFESNISILSGIYPPAAYYDSCVMDVLNTSQNIPTLANILNKTHATSIYAPFLGHLPVDKVLFKNTGFQKVFIGEQHRLANQSADLRSLSEMKLDIENWSARKEPFFAAFFPQIGHGPWPEKLGKTIKERGQNVVKTQLGWIEDIIKILDDNGTLNETIIVVTGDHGVRTKQEDQKVKTGMIDHYAFHIPLIYYNSSKIKASIIETKPTSHIDIPIQILRDLGVSPPKYMQGIPLDAASINRKIYLFADWYFGANGFIDSNFGYMHSRIINTSYKTEKINPIEFQQKQPLTEAQSKNVENEISKAIHLQNQWIENIYCKY